MTLPNEINTATRSLHTRLNALITSRLPLALPPHFSSPDVYLTGILPFVRVFLAFERAWNLVESGSSSIQARPRVDELWTDVLLSPNDDELAASSQTSCKLHDRDDSPATSSNLSALLPHLLHLRPKGLARANRARRDIACLAGIPLDDVDAYLSDHMTDASTVFTRHIEDSVSSKPHVLLAYAFVMYMAIFSGGRWIRSVLSTPGVEFWTSAEMPMFISEDSSHDPLHISSSVHEKLRSFSKSEQQNLEAAGLSFWFWTGLADGLDIKAEFKKRLDDIDALLSHEMRTDVIEEAREIFIRCESLVSELDELVGRQGRVLKSAITIEQEEYEADKAARAGSISLMPTVPNPKSLSWSMAKWLTSPGFAGWTLVLSFVSWFALYQAGFLIPHD